MPTKNDATGESIDFTFGGAKYTVPPADDWDIDVLEAIDEQRLTAALKSLMGEAQYTKFRARHTKVRELGELFEAASKAVAGGNS